jgi:hypothetical protein
MDFLFGVRDRDFSLFFWVLEMMVAAFGFDENPSICLYLCNDLF